MNNSKLNAFKKSLLFGIINLFLISFLFGIDNDNLTMKNSDSKLLVVTNRVLEKSVQSLSFINEVEDKDVLRFFNACDTDLSNVRISEIDSSAFRSEILEKQGNWLFFVHGDAKTFDEAVLNACEIRNIYNVNIVLFAWPSKDKSINGYKNFSTSKKNVEKSIYHFNSLICLFKQLRNENAEFFQNNGLSLFLHSLGNLYIEKMVELKMMPESPSLIFDNIVINAAAVRQSKHKVWLEQIKCNNQIYVISNRHDFNLKGARIFTFSGKQLGEVLHKPLANNANYINFSKSVGFRFPTYLSHTFFIGKIPQESTNIRNFYNDLIHGKSPDLSDQSYFIERKDGLGYDIKF
jgi:hypothetical protein